MTNLVLIGGFIFYFIQIVELILIKFGDRKPNKIEAVLFIIGNTLGVIGFAILGAILAIFALIIESVWAVLFAIFVFVAAVSLPTLMLYLSIKMLQASKKEVVTEEVVEINEDLKK